MPGTYPKMSKMDIEMEGETFGLLTVIGRVLYTPLPQEKDPRPKYVCRCRCGQLHITHGTSLRQGLCKSCGCLKVKVAREVGFNNLGRHRGKHETSL